MSFSETTLSSNRKRYFLASVIHEILAYTGSASVLKKKKTQKPIKTSGEKKSKPGTWSISLA